MRFALSVFPSQTSLVACCARCLRRSARGFGQPFLGRFLLAASLQGFRLVFSFKENPFFTNKQLVKTYHLNSEEDMMLRRIESERWREGGSGGVKGGGSAGAAAHRLLAPLMSSCPVHALPCQRRRKLVPALHCGGLLISVRGARRVRSASASDVPAAALPAASGVHWKPGKDITVKVLKKKPKPGTHGAMLLRLTCWRSGHALLLVWRWWDGAALALLVSDCCAWQLPSLPEAVLLSDLISARRPEGWQAPDQDGEDRVLLPLVHRGARGASPFRRRSRCSQRVPSGRPVPGLRTEAEHTQAAPPFFYAPVHSPPSARLSSPLSPVPGPPLPLSHCPVSPPTRQVPDEDEEAEFTQEELEALEEDMQSDFEIAEMIK